MKKFMRYFLHFFAVILVVQFSLISAEHDRFANKPSPEKVIKMLKDGNMRFYMGKAQHPNSMSKRLKQAGMEDQGDHAYATVLSCSDSRVPVEILFDAGVMDIFVIRVAGNVCDTHEIGSIEYGLSHVNTPVLVVLGHTQCGAVTAVTQSIQGHSHQLELNIPPLVANIIPAVKRAQGMHKGMKGKKLIPHAIEENVWQGIKDLFMRSASTRILVNKGKVKVVGAIYDVSNGKVKWLPMKKTHEILKKVEMSPEKETRVYAKK